LSEALAHFGNEQIGLLKRGIRGRSATRN